MSAWVAVAANQVAITPSTGIALLHGVSRGAIDGFAVGVLASAACGLLVITLLVMRRGGRSAVDGAGRRLRHARGKSGRFRAAAEDEVFAPDALERHGADDPLSAFGDEDAILLGTGLDHAGRDELGWTGYVSKHRMTAPDADLRLEVHHSEPRHAAPSVELRSWESDAAAGARS